MGKFSEFYTVRGYQQIERQENKLTPAMEDYIEMIYRNSLEDGFIRINILSELLNVAAPSATKMVQNLSQLGYINYKKYGYVFLTDKGMEVGQYLLNRHNTIETFLKNIDIKDELLIETELIEHDISEKTLQAISVFNEYLKFNSDILENFINFKNKYSR
jgi:Mn-dependent DtxR family transcriptional regulator